MVGWTLGFDETNDFGSFSGYLVKRRDDDGKTIVLFFATPRRRRQMSSDVVRCRLTRQTSSSSSDEVSTSSVLTQHIHTVYPYKVTVFHTVNSNGNVGDDCSLRIVIHSRARVRALLKHERAAALGG